MTTIPFDLSGNLLYLEADIGASRPMMFLLETGAGMSLVDEESAKDLDLRTVDTVEVAGAGAETAKVNVVEIPRLSIGNLSADGAQVAAASLRHLWGSTGRRIDGLLGFDVLSRFVVDLDYPKRTAAFHKPGDFEYSGTGERLPMTLEFGTLIHVEATVMPNGGAPLTDKFVVDTGAGGLAGLVLTAPFVTKHNLRGSLAHPAGGLGFGGVSMAELGRLKELRLGGISLQQPVTMFSRDTEGFLSVPGRGGVIGNDVLRRFRTIVDCSRQEVILEPNSSANEPFEYDMSGLILHAEGDDLAVIRVTHVRDNSPAAEAGLRPNDIVSGVDGRPAKHLGLNTIVTMFLEDGKSVDLSLVRDGTPLSLRLTTRRAL